MSHAIVAPTASGSDASIALADAFEQPNPPRPYGFGTGSATIAGCESSPGGLRRQRHVLGLQRSRIAGHLGAKAALTKR